jgi:hypothetical protein
MTQASATHLKSTLFKRTEGSLFSPLIDFMTVGGLSYIFIILFVWIFPLSIPVNFAMAAYLAYLINDPHFLSSYQLFYNNFKNKIAGIGISKFMQIRYTIAAIIVPIAIISYFTFCTLTQNPVLLFYSANFMLFLVGWHYTKQSYGMLITLSALKKVYYTDIDKKLFLWNSYIIWGATWVFMNNSISDYNFYGAELSFFKFPKEILSALIISCCVMGVLCAARLFLKFEREKKISINGIIGYSTAYIWLFFRWNDPATYILIPMFHSLQYIPFVLRYKINESILSAAKSEAISKEARTAVAHFVLTALFLGFLGFHALPWLLDSIIPYDTAIFGSALFMFMFVVFINIHHYFIDNVLWRKENTDISKYLFLK